MTAYEMRISDWSSDVCSSDLLTPRASFMARIALPGSRRVFRRRGKDPVMPVETPFRPSRVCEGAMMNNKDLSAQELSAPAIQRMFALGQMSRGFVHDFRNILAVISAGLNLAKRHNSDPDLSNTFLTGAQEGVARGMRMTKRLLDFASGQDCQIRPENVNDALQQLETLLGYAVGVDTRIDLDLDPN